MLLCKQNITATVPFVVYLKIKKPYLLFQYLIFKFLTSVLFSYFFTCIPDQNDRSKAVLE